MRREVILYSSVLLVALTLAFKASMKDELASESDVPVVSLSPEAITAVSYTDKEHQVAVKRIEGSERYSVEYQATQAAKGADADEEDAMADLADHGHGHDHGADPAADPHGHDHGADQSAEQPAPAGQESLAGDKAADAAPSKTEKAKVETSKFAASQTFNTMLKNLNPLYASRMFDDVSAEKLKEFGLEDGQAATLVFERQGSTPVKLLVGQKSFGSDSRFVRVDADDKKRVYVVDGNLIGALKRAKARLFEKEVFSAPFIDFTSLSLAAGGVTKVLRPDKDPAGMLKEWLDDEKNAQSSSVSYKNWLEKLEKVTVDSYVERSAQELGTPVLTAMAAKKDGKPERVDFFAETVPGAGSESPEKTTYFAYIHSLQAVASIPAARFVSVEKDVQKILPKL